MLGRYASNSVGLAVLEIKTDLDLVFPAIKSTNGLICFFNQTHPFCEEPQLCHISHLTEIL